MNELDRALFMSLNAGSSTWGLTAWIAFVAAKYIVMLIPLHLVTIWIFGNHSARRDAIALVSALVLAITVSYLIGAVYPSPRPFSIPLGNQLIEHRGSPSFPSNHGLVMFTYAATMAMLAHWRHAALIAATGLIVAWSRIYIGIHFPFDMVGALLIASASAWITVSVDRVCGRKVTLCAERAYRALIIRLAIWIIRSFDWFHSR